MTTEPQPKKHGCFFYGCVTCVAIFVVGVSAIAFVSWYGLHTLNVFITDNTDSQPAVLPQDQLSAADLVGAKKRLADFLQGAFDSHTNTPALVLTGPEINGLLMSSTNTYVQDLSKCVHFEVQGDQLRGEVSLPLGKMFPDVPLLHLKDRYLNGDGGFVAVLTNDELSIHLASANVHGKAVPDGVITAFSAQNLAQKATQDPKNAQAISKFDSIEIKDGKVIITAKSP